MLTWNHILTNVLQYFVKGCSQFRTWFLLATIIILISLKFCPIAFTCFNAQIFQLILNSDVSILAIQVSITVVQIYLYLLTYLFKIVYDFQVGYFWWNSRSLCFQLLRALSIRTLVNKSHYSDTKRKEFTNLNKICISQKTFAFKGKY